MNNVGLRIRNRRLELGMTQEELAHKVGYKTKASINKLETTRDIPIKKLKPIADALEIDIKVLMGWNEPEDTGAFLADLALNETLLNNVRKLSSLPDDKKQQVYDYIDFVSSR